MVITPTFTRDARELLTALPTSIDREAPTPLWRAVEKAVDSFGPTDGDDVRRVVLVLSDGGDSGFMLGSRFVTAGDVMEVARRQDVMIYGVGMRGRGRCLMGGGLGTGGADPALARVAEDSGGGSTDIDREKTSAWRSRGSPRSCTASICSVSSRRSGTARFTIFRSRSVSRG